MMAREGFAFVRENDKTDSEEDIFIKANLLLGALNEDIVRVAIFASNSPKHKREGRVVEILERSRKPFVGIFHLANGQAWVLMQSKVMPYDIRLNPKTDFNALGARQGMKVAALVDSWEKGTEAPAGHIVDVLGYPGENETEMHSILAEFGLPYKFPEDVVREAGSISASLSPADIASRRDFRKTLTFTIDPSDAKDFDDALSLKELPDGKVEVGVHIADVTHYVTPGSLVDREAAQRSTSVYLVDRTVPMLPEKLCNDLCSLRPHEDKLTFSAVFVLDEKAHVTDRWFGRTVINSDCRLCYEEAWKAITDDNAEGEVAAALKTLNTLAGKLRSRRFESGAINFDRPEIKVIVDDKGRPVDVVKKESNDANFLIEEFMLLANREVAAFVSKRFKVPMVYRVHDKPNPDKVKVLKMFAKGIGIKMGDVEDPANVARSINAMLTKAKGTPQCEALEQLAIRSMAKAVYSSENIGHYGLAFDFYTHFTSPIRRYPDMMVHRILAHCLQGNGSAWQEDSLSSACKWASERETVAAEAERASIKYKIVEFMKDKVGCEYEGRISGLTEWGMYVAIDGSGIEGMVPLRCIRKDFFEFDEKRYRLVGRTTHKIYRMSDPVRIKVTRAEVDSSLLDFELI